MDFIRAWIRNLLIELLIIVVVGVGTLIFLRIFYPDVISMLFLMGQFAVGLTTILKLWPIVILMLIVYPLLNALPRRRRR
jgi:hypothetical protein